MPLSSKNLLLFSLLISLFSSSLIISGDSPVGVTYIPTSGTTPPDRVVPFLQTLPALTRVRLLDPKPDTIMAFSYSGISLLISLPNSFVPTFASNRSNALRWLSLHVIPFYPRARITTISVGDELLSRSPNLSVPLLPAIRNLHLALHEIGIRKISVSTTHSFGIINFPFPPSAARFQASLSDSVLKPLLDFLSTTNGSFLINLYPYRLYRSAMEIPVAYALFQDQQRFNFRDDAASGLRYRNLFDVMVDAVISAMAGVGHGGIPVVVTETGWPSDGDGKEAEANEFYAGAYNLGLVRHLRSELGTPLRREGVAETYIFELFDEVAERRGGDSERHWGLFFPNFTNKYCIDFSGCCGKGRGADLMALVAGFSLMTVVLLHINV